MEHRDQAEDRETQNVREDDPFDDVIASAEIAHYEFQQLWPRAYARTVGASETTVTTPERSAPSTSMTSSVIPIGSNGRFTSLSLNTNRQSRPSSSATTATRPGSAAPSTPITSSARATGSNGRFPSVSVNGNQPLRHSSSAMTATRPAAAPTSTATASSQRGMKGEKLFLHKAKSSTTLFSVRKFQNTFTVLQHLQNVGDRKERYGPRLTLILL